MTSNRGEAGFTLIEILITIVILSVGIVSILHAFETSMNALILSRDVMFGTVLCRDKLSDIKSDVVIGKAPVGTSDGEFSGTFEDYRWTTESSLLPRNIKESSSGGKADKDEDVGVDLYKVKVSVWRNGYPDDRQEAVTFLKL